MAKTVRVKLVNLEGYSREIEYDEHIISAGVIIMRDPNHNSDISHVYRFCDTRRVDRLPTFEEVEWIEIHRTDEAYERLGK